MISKLEKQNTWGECLEKLNEVIDAVNEFHEILHYILNESVKNMSWVDSLESAVLELRAKVNGTDNKPIENPNISKMENVDPYAEQRKWIGKLCKFWFADAEHPTFGILDFVDAGPHPEPFHINCGESEQGWFPHCEPVKPDDDIIYKGE